MASTYPLLRKPLFLLPAERAHRLTTRALDLALATAPARSLLRDRLAVDAPELAVRRWGIHFPNPVGLAAGFDKSGRSFNSLGALGFGFVEIGTVTAQPQRGNPEPRLFRLPADRALLNRMGFNNPGAEAVAERLARTRQEVVLGVNIGKSKVAALEDAVDDYLRSVELLAPHARYLVVNVSSPNTPGLRSLQDAEPLRRLLSAVVRRVAELAAPQTKVTPVLVKLAPDLSDRQLDEALEIAVGSGASGIVAVNTTVSRAGLRTPAAELARLGDGGVSGPLLKRRADEVVSRIHRRTGGEIPIIGVGGIGSADDAWDRIRAGATLVQLYTALVYEGPGLVRRINRGLLERLSREGATSVEDVVGSSNG